MPSFHSEAMLAWLIRRGWVADTKPLPTQTGDPRVIDPQTGDTFSLHAAVEKHEQRTGERPDFLPENTETA